MKSTFANYDLREIAESTDGVLALADGLLREMAEDTGFEGFNDSENRAQELYAFTGHIGTEKTLQDNIETLQAKLGGAIGHGANLLALTSDWARRSGVLEQTNRSFVSPEIAVPEAVEVAVITGGVARWGMRRALEAARTALVTETTIGRIEIPVGRRKLGQGEHSWVAQYMKAHDGAAPTEQDAARGLLRPFLQNAGIVEVNIIPIDSEDGATIFDEYVTQSRVTDAASVLIIGNAPATVMTAGDFRSAARRFDARFDSDRTQLYMVGDGVALGEHGQSARTHQSPFTAARQIGSNAKVLQQNL